MEHIQIPLSSPDITDAEIHAVVEVLRTRHLSLGPKGPEFEDAFKYYLDVHEAVAVSSGTAGLHCCLLAVGIGPGDEVITTPFSFIASANVIKMVGATPVFVDIDPQTLNLDPDKVEAAITPKTKAILAVEAFGNPVGMHEVAAVAARHEIPLIEDSCEGLGSSHKRRKVGTFGRVGVFGFYPNKQITTGEGGMIVTNDKKIADMCRSLRNQGRDPGGSWLSHARLGYNYRLSDLNAAIGIVQMRRLNEIIEARQRVAHEYIRQLLDEPHLILPTIDDHTTMSWFVFVVRLTGDLGSSSAGNSAPEYPMPDVDQLKGRPLGRILIRMGLLTREQVHLALGKQVELKSAGESKPIGQILVDMGLITAKDRAIALAAQDGIAPEISDRDAILAYLRNHHIGCSNYFPPIHLQPFYMKDHGFKRGDFPITERIADRTIALPFHNNLSRMEIDNVVSHLKQAIGHRLK